VTLGSAPGSGLRLDLPTVSPYHARIVVDAGRVSAHDTGSARALHVNDNPLEPGGTVLRNGDILWLGAPGEDDVVMLQCILPRRPVEAPSPDTVRAAAATPPAATPTPEVETMALWAVGPGSSAPSAPRVAAEPVREEATGFEETMAILPRAPAPPEGEDPVVEASLPAEAEEELLVAAEVVAEPGAFIDEAEPSPTLLMASPGEVVEPGFPEPDFSSTVAFEIDEPPATAPTPAPVPPVVAKPSDSVPPAPAARLAAPAPPAPHPTHPSARTPPPRRDASMRHATQPPRQAPAEPEAVEEDATEPSPAPPRTTLLAVAGFMGVLVLAGLGWVAWRFLAGRPAAPTPTPVAQAQAPPATLPTPAPTPATVAPGPGRTVAARAAPPPGITDAACRRTSDERISSCRS
jgi:hypothetical protein